MADATEASLQQLAALQGCFEWEYTTPSDNNQGANSLKTICRVYRHPNNVYSTQVKDGGAIWTAVAIRKRKTYTSVGDNQYKPDWTETGDTAPSNNDSDAVKAAREKLHMTRAVAWYQTGSETNSDNVKSARVLTFADAKLKAEALANSFT